MMSEWASELEFASIRMAWKFVAVFEFERVTECCLVSGSTSALVFVSGSGLMFERVSEWVTGLMFDWVCCSLYGSLFACSW